MFKKIEKIIGNSFFNQKKEEYNNFFKLEKKWKKEISEIIQKNATLIDYTDKKITIKAKNPAWKNELVFFEEEIKKNFHPQK